MNYPADMVAQSWLWPAGILYALILLVAIRQVRWREYLEQPHKAHVFLGSSVALILMWQITTTRLPGLEYHFLGASLMTLMFGWQRALIVISLVLLGLIYNGSSDWQTYPLNVLVMGLTPILISTAILRLAESRLPHHVFIYIFINGFFGAALAMAGAASLAAALLLIAGAYSPDRLAYDYFPYLPLMMFPEAFITGMFTSILVAMRPEWIETFDDARYIQGK
ncbi:energy-coupling factor ABC transporter permease [Thiohalophilus sp.]|uniref:energy-coupling factor ABC transporter permease n=1 Tax=Thiohalophilus sp. TaxID=3028392 RepID=UPI003977153A